MRVLTGVLAFALACAAAACGDGDDPTSHSCTACLSAGAQGGAAATTGGTAPAGSGGGAAGSPAPTGGAELTGGAEPATGGAEPATGGAEPTTGGAGGAPPTECRAVDGGEAQTLVANGALLVDVRTASEYAAGHVDGAVNLPLAELPDRLAELDASRAVVVYCQSGNRSSHAATLLCDAGYTVYDLGPMSNWSG